MPKSMHSNDPYYRSPAAEYLKARFHATTGFMIVTDPSLVNRLVEIHDTDRVVALRPGQDCSRLHDLITRTWLYLTGGPEMAPEFQEGRPQLRLAVPGQRDYRSAGDVGRRDERSG